jgi:hypothetical protein
MTDTATTRSGGHGPVVRAPNLYILHNNVIQGGQFSLSILYSSSGLVGEPLFEYHDGSQLLSFSGNQIRTTELPLGNLVTVTISTTADTGSTTFTLVVPSVGLLGGQSLHINTFGVTTTRRGGILPNIGQQDLYTVTELAGSAEFVVS